MDQIPNSENFMPSFVTTYTDSQDNIHSNMQMLYQPSQPTFQTSATAQTDSENSILPDHPTDFFYRPPQEFCHYYVKCKNISYDNVTHLLNKLKEQNVQFKENEYIFFYKQQHNDQFYQISCEMVSPILVNNCLNRNFGIELQHRENADEKLEFMPNQRANLERNLKQYLSQYSLG